jgi:hypothetical protein
MESHSSCSWLQLEVMVVLFLLFFLFVGVVLWRMLMLRELVELSVEAAVESLSSSSLSRAYWFCSFFFFVLVGFHWDGVAVGVRHVFVAGSGVVEIFG